MFPKDWTPPCGSCCTKKYAALVQIPWRVFCKKGCDADGDTWEDCIGECEEICYKDPVFKDQQWSSYIDRSPGDDSYSMECFNACISGCGFKFDIPPEKVKEVRPSRPLPPPPPPAPPVTRPDPPESAPATTKEVPCTSA
ncbi:defensin-like protein [Rhynchospora pubera]|uniref:Defensin-like protein n=1 Tax=Rhynchospora pubera TaxID=906938 RepID=A0AAV8DYA3_9POAL|nr:defensin-like protein [Rhynchospora pubera]KAJ4806158.1 defensin-like protein [Rhynchospora pubera]